MRELWTPEREHPPLYRVRTRHDQRHFIMNENDNRTGSIRPDRELTELFRAVARDMADKEHGAVKAGANKALLDFLESAPDDVLTYHVERSDFDSLDDLRAAVKRRQNQPFPSGGDDRGA